MVQTKERVGTDLAAPEMTAASGSMSTHTGVRRWRLLRSRLGGGEAEAVLLTPRVRRRRQTGHFIRHYFEMCIPMCIGFARRPRLLLGRRVVRLLGAVQAAA
jgi:hypothetical protein